MATKTLRVTLADILGPAGPAGRVNGEVWAVFVDGDGNPRTIRKTDGTVIVPAKPRQALDSSGVVDFVIVPNDDATVHVDDRGFGVKVGWDLTVRGEHGAKVAVKEAGKVVAVVTADPAIVQYGLKAAYVPVIPGATYPTSGDVSAAVAASASSERTTSDGRYRRKLTGLVANNSAAGVKTANAAILAAALVPNSSVTIPAGTYYTDEVAVTGPVTLQGEDITTTIRNNSGSVLVLTGNQINVSNLTIRSEGGNHTIRQSGVVDQGQWDRVRLYQLADGFSIWDSAGFGVIDMRFTNFLSWHTQTATVPSWKLTSVGGAINNNTWSRFRAQFSGNYHFWIESTSANSHHANVWRDATWEVTTGGCIKMIGCRDYLIENSTVWDLALGTGGLTTLKRHGIHADTNANSASCVGTIRGHKRLDSTCDAGIQDIMLPSSFRGDGTVLENCRNITPANPLLVDINNNVSRVMIDGPTASSLSTITNAATTALYDRNGITLPTTQTFKVGTAALVGFGLAQANVTADPASIAANSELDVTVAVTGAATTDAVSVSPGNGALEAGIGIVGCWVPSAGNVTFRLRNFTGSAIDPVSRLWRIRVWR